MAEDRGYSYAHTVGVPPDDDDVRTLHSKPPRSRLLPTEEPVLTLASPVPGKYSGPVADFRTSTSLIYFFIFQDFSRLCRSCGNPAFSRSSLRF